MGWQLINTNIRTSFPNNDDGSLGYLIGSGNEEGFYCFRKNTYHARPFISKTFMPYIEIQEFNNKKFVIQDYSFNNSPVYQASSDSNANLFFSAGQNSYVYPVGVNGGGEGVGLREPYYYTDIDETTLQGDYFYKGAIPNDLNGEPTTWSIEGAVPNNYSGPSTIHVLLKQEYWEWKNNGVEGLSDDPFCGKYKNDEKDTWKMVGIPTFSTFVQISSAYVAGERFKRGEKDGNHNFIYYGDKGHTIHCNGGEWMMGTQTVGGHWSIGNEPSMHPGTEISFRGYEVDSGTNEIIPDPKGDFKVIFSHCAMGDQKGNVYMGEVSLWRKKETEGA